MRRFTAIFPRALITRPVAQAFITRCVAPASGGRSFKHVRLVARAFSPRSFALVRLAGMLLALSIVAFAACSGSSSAIRTAVPVTATVATVQFATTQLRIESASGARDIEVEVATTAQQSERGLGYRDALAPDAGMIFDLHATRSIGFWMKGMRFALDMVWIGDDKRVVAITADVRPEPGVPDNQPLLYSPGTPVRYVLELNAGAAKRIGIATGAQLSFELP